MPIADRTTLNALTPNLDIGDVADPALRLAYFQYMTNLSDANYAEFVAYRAGIGRTVDGGFFTDSDYPSVIDGGTFT